MLNIFSKTKNIDKIREAYLNQYNNITEALNKHENNKESIQDKHGKRLFGDVEKIIKIQINDGIEDLRGNFTTIYENEFNLLKAESENALKKWIYRSKDIPIMKFSSEEFLEENLEFISKNTNIPYLVINEIEESEVIQAVKYAQLIRNKYLKQKKVLKNLPNSKNKPLLEKAHIKSLSKLKDKEEETKKFISNFNQYIRYNLVFKSYDLDIDFSNPDFNDYTLNESLCFFNIILHLIKNNKIGLFQPYKSFIKKSELEKFNFDLDNWIPYFKQFGLIVV